MVRVRTPCRWSVRSEVLVSVRFPVFALTAGKMSWMRREKLSGWRNVPVEYVRGGMSRGECLHSCSRRAPRESFLQGVVDKRICADVVRFTARRWSRVSVPPGDLLCFRHSPVRPSRPPTRLNMAVVRLCVRARGQVRTTESWWKAGSWTTRPDDRAWNGQSDGRRTQHSRVLCPLLRCRAVSLSTLTSHQQCYSCLCFKLASVSVEQ